MVINILENILMIKQKKKKELLTPSKKKVVQENKAYHSFSAVNRIGTVIVDTEYRCKQDEI